MRGFLFQVMELRFKFKKAQLTLWALSPQEVLQVQNGFFLKLQMKDVKTGSLGGKSKLLRLWCQGQSSSPKMRMTERAGFLGLAQSWI